MWFQCDKRGWDRHAGSSFFVNVQVGGESRPWGGPTKRLQELLDDAGLQSLRAVQDQVIGRLKPPPVEYLETLRAGFARYPDGEGMFAAILASFGPVEAPYCREQDVALRYFDLADVERWAMFRGAHRVAT